MYTYTKKILNYDKCTPSMISSLNHLTSSKNPHLFIDFSKLVLHRLWHCSYRALEILPPVGSECHTPSYSCLNSIEVLDGPSWQSRLLFFIEGLFGCNLTMTIPIYIYILILFSLPGQK